MPTKYTRRERVVRPARRIRVTNPPTNALRRMTRDEVDVDDNQTREKANEVTIERKVPRTLNERKEGEVKKRFVPRQPRKDKRRWLGEHGKMTQNPAQARPPASSWDTTQDEVDVDDDQTKEKANEVTIECKPPKKLNERREGQVKEEVRPRQPRKDKDGG
ncbi:hypothetical protein CCMSSC00406_0001797 [Pleurotus cornucopiae]|uniref:Uncharacterized protein n=1 Tax=Pleurotus cornucopiae TaxID=5321 RepID=A0ACB7J3B3_PLECO|nr:hypothetical protein CCMSSC00406_0001797 [Pleurotus cornucopiae]